MVVESFQSESLFQIFQTSLILQVIFFFISSFFLWISAKLFGSRLSFFLSLVIVIISTVISQLLPLILPINILLFLLINFITRIFLISSFGQVGIIRAVFIDILSIVLPVIVVVVFAFILIFLGIILVE
ncbi:MAG: hypothetical protein QXO27_02360 [Candidatus Aenigmatarchaeota archaeon]